MESKNLWWKKPLRVIQTNLQVRDTPKMDPEKIAGEILDMGANVLVMNVGGIYAWYPTEIPWHVKNPYLPQGRDLLAELIDACHRRGIRLVARYDFSKCSDRVYQTRPQWFSRDPDGRPQPVGVTRPGEWDLLYTTCINGGYRTEISGEILRESLSRYEIDGVFLNAPHASDCHCEVCRERYLARYGVPLPESSKDWDPDWKSHTLHTFIAKLRGIMHEEKPDIPLILYYAIAQDNLYDRLDTCDMICCEPQDVLSLGWKEIPQSFKPALCIRLGCSEPSIPRPFGIIHSCPGMEWRHTGLPPAEYMYWMSQVPANGGQIWHSITGFGDTIGDKRILDCVSRVNHAIMKVENHMAGAVSRAKTAVLWNMASDNMGKAFGGQVRAAANGWAEVLLNEQIPFDVILPEQLTGERLAKYKLLILPDGVQNEKTAEAVRTFAENGGRLILECAERPNEAEAGLMGADSRGIMSEELRAAYIRPDPESKALRPGAEETPLLPFRGRVTYLTPKAGTRVTATLVPPFAPPEAVGAPPERASMNVSETDLPMMLENPVGEGAVVSFPFALSGLMEDYKLADHANFAASVVRMLLGNALDVHTEPIRGIQLIDYDADGSRLLHIVNGIGQRPLSVNIPVPVTLTLDGYEKLPKVDSLLGEAPKAEMTSVGLRITTAPVTTWDVLRITKE